MTGRWLAGARRGLAALAMAVTMTGCAGSAPEQSPPASAARWVLALNVATIDVVEEYRSPRIKPNVEHLAPLPPSQAVRRWAGERLRAVGRSGSVKVIIRDASITETQLPRTEGIKGWFTTDQSQRYDGRIEVKIVGQAPDAKFSGYAQAMASRSITVPEDISLTGREETWNTLVHQMMDDLDGQLERGIHDGLGPLLRR